MLKSAMTAIVSATAFLVLSTATPAQAQATRTWVSGVGDDANPCSRTAPCKTFAGAISKTAAKGEISVLDPGGFGAVTITKAISLVSDGSEGSILASGTTGIIINITNPALGDTVNLHGLLLEGAGTGVSGIKILSASAVNIRKCVIRGFMGAGATQGGIEITPTAAATKVTVSDCAINDNIRGIMAVPTAPGAAQVVLDRVVVARNGGVAVRATSAAAVIWLSNSVVTGNGLGLSPQSSGVIHSFGNNVVINNTTDGAPTDTIPLN